MKRCYFGLGLLAGLLAVSLVVTWGMAQMHQPVARALEAAEEQALSGDWQGAVALENTAREEWEAWRGLRSCFVDHTPMEQIDAQFALLGACIRAGQQAEFPGLAAQTAQMVKAMGDAHGLKVGNFF